jgi:hypothetical protein
MDSTPEIKKATGRVFAPPMASEPLFRLASGGAGYDDRNDNSDGIGYDDVQQPVCDPIDH